MALAVGPAYVVQIVNSSIAVFQKNTGALAAGFPKKLSTFFPGSSGDLGDPRAFYDWQANRFVVLADDFTAGVVRLAASSSANPVGTWFMYTFGPTVWGPADCRAVAPCADFPMLGFDDSTIYLGVNFFSPAAFVTDFMLLLPKATIYAGGALPGFNFFFGFNLGGTQLDTIQPVTLLTESEHPRAGFAVNSLNINFGGGQCVGGCNGLVVWAFSNTLGGAPQASGVFVPTATTYTLPAFANQPGAPASIDTDDPRISGTPVYHAGLFAASLNTNGVAGLSRVLWFQLAPILDDLPFAHIIGATLVNEECLFCTVALGTAGAEYYGTLAPDKGGDLFMAFNYSDTITFPESAYVSRRATQTPNTLSDGGFVLCGGGSTYTGVRWGDYTAAVGDNFTSIGIGPQSIQNSVWVSGMNSDFGVNAGKWTTCIGKDAYTAPTQP